MACNIEGRVASVTPQGNLVTDIPLARLAGAPSDESVRVLCDEFETRGLFPPDHGQPEMTFIAILSGGGMLELVLVGESASAFFGLKAGAKVVVSW